MIRRLVRLPWRRAWLPTSVFFSGKSPWTEQPGEMRSMGLQRVRHNQVTFTSLPPLPSFLPPYSFSSTMSFLNHYISKFVNSNTSKILDSIRLCCESCPTYCKISSNISDFYSLETTSKSPVMIIKISSELPLRQMFN